MPAASPTQVCSRGPQASNPLLHHVPMPCLCSLILPGDSMQKLRLKSAVFKY